VEWSYTSTDNSTKPSVSWLRLVKLNGDVIELDYRGNSIKAADPEFLRRLDGVFVITSIELSRSAITTLRMCGSGSASDFLTAFGYYSLWELTESAKSPLKGLAESDKSSLKESSQGEKPAFDSKTGYYSLPH